MSTPAIEWFDGSRDELADLFALADDSPAALSGTATSAACLWGETARRSSAISSSSRRQRRSGRAEGVAVREEPERGVGRLGARHCDVP